MLNESGSKYRSTLWNFINPEVESESSNQENEANLAILEEAEAIVNGSGSQYVERSRFFRPAKTYTSRKFLRDVPTIADLLF